VYVSNEAESLLDVWSGKRGDMRENFVERSPNNIAVTKMAGKYWWNPSDPGNGDVIDAVSLARVKSIFRGRQCAHVFVTPDGNYAVSGSIENKAATVIDLKKGSHSRR